MSREDKREWKKAMNVELESMQTNKAWDLVELPPGKFAIKNRWVFRLKRHPDGSIDKYRARMVIQGCAQRPGIDFDDTFSPVTRLDTVRSLLAIAAKERMKLKHFDVSAAFLYGDISETIYMRQPEGFEDGTNRVCKLKRSLYGLKQASRCWNQKFDDFMGSLNFVQSKEDPCLYVRHKNAVKIFVALYVDDGLVASNSSSEIETFISELQSKFKIVAKELTYFLGLEITQVENGIAVGQAAFVKKILDRFGMSNCNKVSTPIEKLPNLEPGKVSEPVDFPYRSAVGALLYLARGTRFDISFVVSVLSRTLENPSQLDVGRIKRVFRYLAGTINHSLVYEWQPGCSELSCYSDADFAGCNLTYRSTSGIVIKFAGAAIVWSSRRQQVVADSTCEAELVSANAASKEIIWLSRLFRELIGYSEIPILQVDNEAAKRLCENPEFHSRTKHIDRKCFFVRDRVREGLLKVRHVESSEQLADLFTKPMPRARLFVLCDKLGLKPS